MEMFLVLVVVVVVGVGAALLARRVQHPEQAASHDDTARDTTSDDFYNPTDRPAGPDAEDPPVPPNRFPEQSDLPDR